MNASIIGGTSAVYGPVDAVGAFYAGIPGSRLLTLPAGFYSFPCNASLPSISFSWGDSGQAWHITAEKLVSLYRRIRMVLILGI